MNLVVHFLGVEVLSVAFIRSSAIEFPDADGRPVVITEDGVTLERIDPEEDE